ncbi:MAG: helix-turn-helix transcriptional regulator [Lachnospiraceae bacterium]|nr:helix-turn-helix transcriptional regulator [Lachnospiraceae bacterium]
MPTVYSKPMLTSLKQGARIAFIRKLRHISQPEFARLTGNMTSTGRNLICRYERTNRTPKPFKLKRFAEVLDVNIRMIEKYDFSNPADLFYVMLWMEELCPNFTIERHRLEGTMNESQRVLSEKYLEWQTMKKKYDTGKISFDEYWNWKLKKD